MVAGEPGENERHEPRHLTLWQTWMSVLAAFFGVQTNANRERDAVRGRASHFILLGLAATVLLVLTLVGVVMLITRLAQP